MPRYTLYGHSTISVRLQLEADSPALAMELAKEKSRDDSWEAQDGLGPIEIELIIDDDEGTEYQAEDVEQESKDAGVPSLS